MTPSHPDSAYALKLFNPVMSVVGPVRYFKFHKEANYLDVLACPKFYPTRSTKGFFLCGSSQYVHFQLIRSRQYLVMTLSSSEEESINVT